jgi:hypothetical protein
VGSPEFHPQPTSGQNTLHSLLLAGGFSRISHPINFRPKQQQTQIIFKINQTQIHKSRDTSKQGLQNTLQQISWVCLKSNKRFTHTHTHGRKFTTQPTHTTEITNDTTENTPNRSTKEKSTENTFQPLEVAGNHSSIVGRRPATRRKIGASTR